MATLTIAAWQAMASMLFISAIGFWSAFSWPDRLWAWPRYLIEAPPNAIVHRWLVISAVLAALPLMVLGVLISRFRLMRPRAPRRSWGGAVRDSEPGVTDNHGHSAWRTILEAQQAFPGPHSVHGGIAVGEAYRVDETRFAHVPFKPEDKRTWGKGGTAPLLIDPCTRGSGHSLVFAGTGAFKTTSAVSTVLTWTGSSVILDPSTELGPMLDREMRRQGKAVAHIGIPTEDDSRPPATGFNVLSWIDFTDPEAEVHVRTVVSWLADPPVGVKEDPFFAPAGRDLITCLLAHLVWSDPQAVEISLATLAAGMAFPETDMLDLLAGIRATSRSPMARRLAGTLMQCKAEETFSGVYLNAVGAVSFLFISVYADALSRGDFDPRTLLTGKTTVFLNIGLRTLETTPALARVLVGALLNTVYRDDGRSGHRVLFLLDECARLGRLRALETARDTGRKYRVSLHLLMQSTGQLIETWGREGARAWIDAAAWIGYAAIRAGGAGKDLAEELYPNLGDG